MYEVLLTSFAQLVDCPHLLQRWLKLPRALWSQGGGGDIFKRR